MKLNSNMLLTIGAVLLLVYLLTYNNKPVHNTGAVSIEEEVDMPTEAKKLASDVSAVPAQTVPSVQPASTVQPAPEDQTLPEMVDDEADRVPTDDKWVQIVKGKFDSRNKARNGYKKISYKDGTRGHRGVSGFDAWFDQQNNIVGGSQLGYNDQFGPRDETNAMFASFKSDGNATCGSNQNCEPEDLFDVDKVLPQEVHSDWFETPTHPVSVKNRHLVNVVKPIGVNTIGTSKKNASYDIRRAPACPKKVLSPWLQSSIDPDINIKTLL